MKIEFTIKPEQRAETEAALIDQGAEWWTFAEGKYQTDNGDVGKFKKLDVLCSFPETTFAVMFLATISFDPDRAALFKLFWGGNE